MSDNLNIWNKLKAVPSAAKKKIFAGRLKGMTDIKPQWRLQMMTEQFGPVGIGWYYEPIKKWTEECGGEISAHVDLNLYLKDGDNWSAPIFGTGGAMLLSMEKTKEYDKPIYEFPGLKPYHSDEAYKMATTDALSVAMKQLGVAADVYMGLSDSKYDKPADNTHKAPEKPAQKFEEYTSKAMTGKQKGTLRDQLMDLEKLGSESANKAITAINTFLGSNNPGFDDAVHLINKVKLTLGSAK
jgi:hypothetical protein